MRERCVRTTTSDERAVGGGVEELVGAVRRYVEGKTTEVRVEGGRGVEEVVAKLNEANVEASAGRMETRGGRNGLEVVVRVVTEGKGEAKFVGRVEVVGKVVKALSAGEKAVRKRERAVRKARVETGAHDKVVGDKMYRPKGGGSEEYAEGTGRWLSPRVYVCWVELPSRLEGFFPFTHTWWVLAVGGEALAVRVGYVFEINGGEGGHGTADVLPSEEGIEAKKQSMMMQIACSVLTPPDAWD
jgi:hypothetical protein